MMEANKMALLEMTVMYGIRVMVASTLTRVTSVLRPLMKKGLMI